MRHAERRYLIDTPLSHFLLLSPIFADNIFSPLYAAAVDATPLAAIAADTIDSHFFSLRRLDADFHIFAD